MIVVEQGNYEIFLLILDGQYSIHAKLSMYDEYKEVIASFKIPLCFLSSNFFLNS
jgi:hypothetical protein